VREEGKAMRRGARWLGVVLVVGLTLWPGGERAFGVVSAAACRTFAETGRTVCNPFLAYWDGHGGLAQQGLPLTDEFTEVSPTDGKPYTVQYFERARFEKHPENAPPYVVLLGLLGREQYQAKYTAPPAAIPGDPFNNPALPQECFRFAETNHNVCGPFLAYWRDHGGLPQQGLPLTDIFLEQNPTNGLTYPTQYFERARFEYHYEYAGTANAVLLGLLGREQLLAKYPNGPGGSPAPSATPAPSPSAVPAPSPSPSVMPSPSPSPAPPAANYQVSATVSNGSPTKNSNVTVTATLTNNGQGVAGATMDTTWHYKTTTSSCSGGPSGGDGRMSCTRDISTASSGYTVVISVVVHYQGQDFTTSTSFTPR
jgi:hypothetical protein